MSALDMRLDIRIPRWSWGFGPPGGWLKEHMIWLANYQRGIYDPEPDWSCWITGWEAMTERERVTNVRTAIRSSNTSLHRTFHSLGLWMEQPEEDKRTWARLTMVDRLAAEYTRIKSSSDQRPYTAQFVLRRYRAEELRLAEYASNEVTYD